jgi:hypothetical protein
MIPKTIRNHPSVKFADLGDNQGSDYKYYCELKEGWKFTSGRMEGCSSLFFNTVRDFREANPKKD